MKTYLFISLFFMGETQPKQTTPERDPDGFVELFNGTFSDVDSLCQALFTELKGETGGAEEKYAGETIFVNVERGGTQIHSQEEAIFPQETEDSLEAFVEEVRNALIEKHNVGEGDYTLKMTNQ